MNAVFVIRHIGFDKTPDDSILHWPAIIGFSEPMEENS